MLAVAYFWYLLSHSKSIEDDAEGETDIMTNIQSRSKTNECAVILDSSTAAKTDSDISHFHSPVDQTTKAEELSTSTAYDATGTGRHSEKSHHNRVEAESDEKNDHKPCFEPTDSDTDRNQSSIIDSFSLANHSAMNDSTNQAEHQLPGESTQTTQQGDEEKVAGGPRFDPPVYVQRYTLVQNILQEHQVESVC